MPKPLILSLAILSWISAFVLLQPLWLQFLVPDWPQARAQRGFSSLKIETTRGLSGGGRYSAPKVGGESVTGARQQHRYSFEVQGKTYSFWTSVGHSRYEKVFYNPWYPGQAYLDIPTPTFSAIAGGLVCLWLGYGFTSWSRNWQAPKTLEPDSFP